MVAALCAWHVHHSQAIAEIERRLRRAERMLVAAPALVDAYSVLTRFPPPHRVSPTEALTLLEANFFRLARIIVLDRRGYQGVLAQAPGAGILGGRIYDAVIAACVLRARGTTLLTFNADHFLPFEQDGLEVVVPGEG